MAATKKTVGLSFRSRWKPLVDCIADLLGSRAEVVLHDVRRPERSIVYIRNGHITGRSVGAPLTDLGFLMLRDAKKGKDTLGVYPSRTDSGRQLKCNALVLRNDDGAVVGILCVNLDVTGTAAAVLDGHKPPEHYHTSVAQVIGDLISHATDRAHSSANLSSQEKLEIVSLLRDQGVFLARGAVKEVSQQLGIAASTVYKYIQDARTSVPRTRS